MEDLIKVVILSLIEGITEFLPISSTGHLIVGTSVLNFDRMGSVFEIFIQIGAVVAVVVYYRKTFIRHARTVRSDESILQFWMLVVVAFVPAALVGFLFVEDIERLLFSPAVVAVSLIVGGFVFLTGLTFGIVVPLQGLYAANVYKEKYIGTLMGIQTTVIGIAGATGPLLSGITVEITGGYQLLILLSVGITLLASVIFSIGK